MATTTSFFVSVLAVSLLASTTFAAPPAPETINVAVPEADLRIRLPAPKIASRDVGGAKPAKWTFDQKDKQRTLTVQHPNMKEPSKISMNWKPDFKGEDTMLAEIKSDGFEPKKDSFKTYRHSWGSEFSWSTPTKGSATYYYLQPEGETGALKIGPLSMFYSVDWSKVAVDFGPFQPLSLQFPDYTLSFPQIRDLRQPVTRAVEWDIRKKEKMFLMTSTKKSSPEKNYHFEAKWIETFSPESTIKADIENDKSSNDASVLKLQSPRKETYSWGDLYTWNTPTFGSAFHFYLHPKGKKSAVHISGLGPQGLDWSAVEFVATK